MTINDMLEQGIVFQGHIEVRQYDPERGGRFTAHSELHDNGLMGRVDKEWADLPVGYMYSPYGCNGLVIEVG